MATFENKQTVEILKVSSRLLDKQTEAVPYQSSPLKKKSWTESWKELLLNKLLT